MDSWCRLVIHFLLLIKLDRWLQWDSLRSKVIWFGLSHQDELFKCFTSQKKISESHNGSKDNIFRITSVMFGDFKRFDDLIGKFFLTFVICQRRESAVWCFQFRFRINFKKLYLWNLDLIQFHSGAPLYMWLINVGVTITNTNSCCESE